VPDAGPLSAPIFNKLPCGNLKPQWKEHLAGWFVVFSRVIARKPKVAGQRPTRGDVPPLLSLVLWLISAVATMRWLYLVIQSESLSTLRGIMANLTNALQQLRAEQREAKLHVEKLGQAISVIESLNRSGTSRSGKQATRIISAASRRKMARAQKARWAKVRKGAEPVAKTTGPAAARRTISVAGRRKIAAAQRARWAKVKAGQKKAA
jgi:hypothetical protein